MTRVSTKQPLNTESLLTVYLDRGRLASRVDPSPGLTFPGVRRPQCDCRGSSARNWQTVHRRAAQFERVLRDWCRLSPRSHHRPSSDKDLSP